MNKCLTKETAFPIEVLTFVPLHLSENLTESVQAQLQKNINLMRNAIVFITAYSKVRGLGGHTGGAYDIVPELIILDALRRGGADIHGVFYDDAGHRVAAHYVLAALTPEHDLGADALLRYREYAGGLPGHPERAEEAPGFSSGRLGHIWPYANGIAMAENKRIIVFSSDGAQQEGNNAEAARFAVAHQLPVTVIIDDNDVTIAGKTSEYLPGFDLKKTLEGFGISTFTCNGEDLKELFATIKKALDVRGPSAVVCKRKIAPGIKGLEGSNKAHDAIPVDIAIEYLGQNQQEAAVALLEQTTKQEKTSALLGSSSEKMKNRSEFGKILCDIIDTLPEKERSQLIRVFDSDLAGSCGLLYVKERHPELFVSGGIMERHNFSAAAGFGSEYGRQGVFATFAVFLEMLVSELSMARLNHANVLVHLSHSGVDEISDNTTHFGLNNFFADNGLDDDTTRLYFPADGHQLRALMMRIFDDPGVRFVFSNRSALPAILTDAGEPFFSGNYVFTPGVDDLIRDGEEGFVVSYGETLCHALDAVERAREAGIKVGLVNKATLNLVDEKMLARIGKASFVLVVEGQHAKHGLGVRFGSLLLARGYSPHYAYIGTGRRGDGGFSEQLQHQGLDAASILAKIQELAKVKEK